jgi:tRNA threonylcarbamoyladenosine biosynthesis protein TsaB
MSPLARSPLLALHTTEPDGSVALGSAAGTLARPLAAGGSQAPALLATIVELLAAANRSFADLAGIVVSSGPGSFTGIRVGLATAQGFAAARAWRLHSCDSLLARAAAWVGRTEPLAVVLDARRDEVYAALYNVQQMPPRVLLPPFCAAPVRAAAQLRAAAAGNEAGSQAAPLALTGSGAELLREELPAARVLQEPPVPVAAALLELAWSGGCVLLDPQAVEPLYLRKSDAEVRRDRFFPPAV